MVQQRELIEEIGIVGLGRAVRILPGLHGVKGGSKLWQLDAFGFSTLFFTQVDNFLGALYLVCLAKGLGQQLKFLQRASDLRMKLCKCSTRQDS